MCGVVPTTSGTAFLDTRVKRVCDEREKWYCICPTFWGYIFILAYSLFMHGGAMMMFWLRGGSVAMCNNITGVELELNATRWSFYKFCWQLLLLSICALHMYTGFRRLRFEIKRVGCSHAACVQMCKVPTDKYNQYEFRK